MQHVARSERAAERQLAKAGRLAPQRVALVFRYLGDAEGLIPVARSAGVQEDAGAGADSRLATEAWANGAVGRTNALLGSAPDSAPSRPPVRFEDVPVPTPIPVDLETDRSRWTVAQIVETRRTELIWYVIALSAAVIFGVLAARIV